MTKYHPLLHLISLSDTSTLPIEWDECPKELNHVFISRFHVMITRDLLVESQLDDYNDSIRNLQAGQVKVSFRQIEGKTYFIVDNNNDIIFAAVEYTPIRRESADKRIRESIDGDLDIIDLMYFSSNLSFSALHETFWSEINNGTLQLKIVIEIQLSMTDSTKIMSGHQFYQKVVNFNPFEVNLLLKSSGYPTAEDKKFDLLRTPVLPECEPQVMKDCEDIHPALLVPTLYPYQKRCVAWMLSKEGWVFDSGNLRSYKASLNVMAELLMSGEWLWKLFGCWSNDVILDDFVGAKAILADEVCSFYDADVDGTRKDG